MVVDASPVEGCPLRYDPSTDSILVRAPNWVGDAVMALPFFVSLRKNAPTASITCLCRPLLAPLYRCVPEIDKVFELDEAYGRHGLSFVWRNAAGLRAHGFDVAFCLPVSFGSAAMLWLARIPRRVGHAADGRRMFLTGALPYGKNGHRPHRTEGYLELLRLLWPEAVLLRDLVFRPAAEACAQFDLLSSPVVNCLTSPVLAIAPGAAQPNKMWDAARFAEIARRWIDTFKGTVVLVGADVEQGRCREIMDQVGHPGTRNLAGAGDLVLTAEIMRRADALLGNDSGLAHLAAAVGTPTVVIAGPGDPAEVAPFTTLAVTVRRPVFCSPCFRNSCWRRDKPLECLTGVSVDDVWSHISRMAAKSSRSA